jgi:aminomethyltransferase
MRQTPLIGEHRAARARLVEFAGWEMPLHYGSQIEEHHAVRRDAGVFDTSHMRALDVAGDAASGFLRRALANDVAGLTAPGRALYSCLLAEDGGVLDDLIVYFLGGTRYRLVVNAATARRDRDWLEGLRPAGATLRERDDLCMLAVQGPAAPARLRSALPEYAEAAAALQPFCAAEAGDALVARTGYTGEDGYELLLPSGEAPAAWRRLTAAGVRPCGLGARDTLRLEAGMNLYGQDMDESVTPDECGLAWTVARDPQRDFIGRAGLQQRAPRFQLLGLVLRERGVPRSHQAVRSAHGAGEITSGTFSPTLGAGIALARLPLGCAPGDALDLDVRGRWLPAQVVRYPFVRNGKSLLAPEPR